MIETDVSVPPPRRVSPDRPPLVDTVRRLVPDPLRAPLRHLGNTVLDAVDALRGRDRLRPPRRLVYTGSGSFDAIGREFLGYFVELGGLQPTDRVLDVGSGIGRMAIPLTGYLKGGAYEGFDVVEPGVQWCRDRITPRHPNFRFQLADLHNTLYNPTGPEHASDFRFPYEPASFDFVLLTSVFTHLLPPEVSNYLGEIERVLRPGGRVLMTFFLLNDESAALTPEVGGPPFSVDRGDHRLVDAADPAEAVAFDERWVREAIGRAGLQLTGPVRYGSWCGRARYLSYQDIVIAHKPPTPPAPAAG